MAFTPKLLQQGAGGGLAKNYIEDVFSTYLYAGNGSTQTITNGIDLSTKGGLVWSKNRTSETAGTNRNRLHDSARGVTMTLVSSSTAAQDNLGSASISSFNTNGYTLGGDSFNNASDPWVSWTFRKQPKFFDVVTYSGNSTAGNTVAHNLGSVPGTIIVKITSGSGSWFVYHRSLGATKYILLDDTGAAGTSGGIWNNTEPTSSVFTLGNDGSVNSSGQTYVAYLFAHDAGGFGLTGTDNVISCGGTALNGSGFATVSLGYEPQFVMIKSTQYAGDWAIYDTMRGAVALKSSDLYSAFSAQKLLANSSAAESTATDYTIAPSSTGFTLSATGYAGAAYDDFIYIAIRRGPMKVPTSGTSVYNADFYKGSNSPPAWISGFVTDVGIYKNRSGGSSNTFDRLRGQQQLSMDTTDAESVSDIGRFDFMNGWYNQSGAEDTTLMSWMFRRAPSFMDVVCYTGTGVARTVTHNLGVVPEMMIVKRRDAAGAWRVYVAPLGPTQFLGLDSSNAADTSSVVWDATTPTSSVFSVATNGNTNASGGTFVAYLFATCAGVSKVGSYTGTATTKQIDCGFTAGSRFVLIKRTDSTGDWYVWDSLRGIISGNDPYLLLNGGGASPEVTNTDYIDTYSAGFEISSTAPSAINASGGTFIFLAIA